MKLTHLFLGLGMTGLAVFGLGVSNTEAAEVSHTVQSGESLSTIAQQYFGDASKYTVIANANNIANANFIVSGQVLTFDTASTNQTVQVPQETQSQQVAQTQQVQQTQAPASSSEHEAKEWIAQKESGGSYTASNGQYYGRYQLNPGLYAGYDTTPAGQEAAANAYVTGRYGSWSNAKSFWLANGWY